MTGQVAEEAADSVRSGSRSAPPLVVSPFERRHIQVTLAVLAASAMLWMLVTWWQLPSGSQLANPAAEWANDGSSDENRFRVVIDLNRAEARELSLLPGVGPVLARRIVENRDRLGPFSSVGELQRVHGLGPKTLQQIEPYCSAGARGAAKP